MQSKDITDLLDAWAAGDEAAFEALLPLVLDDLRSIARAQLKRERPDHTLQPTALINEVHLRFASLRHLGWRDRVHFFGACAATMRRILVDHARRRQADKRGGGATLLSLETLEEPSGGRPRTVDLLALAQAMERLEQLDGRQSRLVELRYFAGLSVAEAATALGLAERTVKLEWRKARIFLFRQLHPENSP
ncbi:MAG: ECF-type sigma factor [Holophagales bacterium]|nr:ECF-type sigma factor [Holophagales bacterium]